MAVHLAPPPTPVGRFPRFMSPRPETLVLKEKIMSLSGDSFDVKTIEGRPVLRVQGHSFSWSGRKEVMDVATGQHLFTIRRQRLVLHATFYAEDPVTAENVFSLKGHFSFGSSKSTGSFVSANGKQESLAMKGDFFDRKADITDAATGQPLARIDRQFLNARELLGGQQTYHVTVAPNVDLAIIAAMCICLDERRNESSGGAC